MRISALATQIPDGRIEAEEIIRAGGGTPTEARVFRRLFGLDSVAALRAGESVADNLEAVLSRLAARHDGAAPDTLIHVQGLPVRAAGEPLPMARLRGASAFLSEVTRVYEVDQAHCAGLFWALDLARVLLEARTARCVAVLAGDGHAGLRLGDRYVPGCTLMGDAFCGLVLDLAEGGPQVGDIVLQAYPEFSFGHAGDEAQMGAFFAGHGRMVRRALDALGFAWGEGGPLLPHNVNAMAWSALCRETGLARARVHLGLLPDVGHCYTSDPFLLLDRTWAACADDETAVEPTLLSVGMGGFVGACRLSPASSSRPSSPPTLFPGSKDRFPCTRTMPS